MWGDEGRAQDTRESLTGLDNMNGHDDCQLWPDCKCGGHCECEPDITTDIPVIPWWWKYGAFGSFAAVIGTLAWLFMKAMEAAQ